MNKSETQRGGSSHSSLSGTQETNRFGRVVSISLAFCLWSIGCAGPPARSYRLESNTEIKVLPAWKFMALAELSAKEWREDAHLVSIDIDVSPTVVISYVFGSDSDPSSGAVIYIEDPLGDAWARRTETYSPTRTQALPAIPEAARKGIDSPVAFSIAFDYGGRAYISRHTSATTWFLQLRCNPLDEGLDAPWRVYFGVPGESAFEVFIDPSSGEVIEKRERP